MKRLVSFVLALVLSLAVSIPALAVENIPTQEKISSETITRAEQTQWYYRVYNGERQKRLWSITNEIWLTDWMPYSTPYPA